MNYTIYDPATGEIQMAFVNLDPATLEQNLQGRAWIPGNYNSRDHYVVQGQAIAKPPQPEIPGLVYQFDYELAVWRVDLDRSVRASRQLRDSMLATIDRINAVWYNSLTTQQQQELVQQRYREQH